MLEIEGRIHDRYTLEFKVGYSRYSPETAVSDFMMDTWIFIPDSLYINSKTYSKNNFYRDCRSLVRLITPVYTLEEVADTGNMPLSRLKVCCDELVNGVTDEHIRAYEHQIKMFSSIVRSALRSSMSALYQQTEAEVFKVQLDRIVELLDRIMEAYRQIPSQVGLERISHELSTCYTLGEEYLCQIINLHLFRGMEFAHKRFPDSGERLTEKVALYVDREWEYQRQKGFLLPCDDQQRDNRDYLHRTGQLKKYVESDLYILAQKRSNIFFWEQIFFMFAAGISMVFATVISFSFQQTYGNFTLPLFVALVVSYMFKDRFKDLMHYWFSTKLGNKFYDYKIKLALYGEPVGWGKEGFDFVDVEKLPPEIRARRGHVSELEAGHCAVRETVMVYRRRISILDKQLKRLSHYSLQGMNDIIRMNLRDFLRRMDSPHAPVYINEGGGRFHTLAAEKVYYLHFVMRYRYQGRTGYRRYQVCLTRRGVKSLEEC